MGMIKPSLKGTDTKESRLDPLVVSLFFSGVSTLVRFAVCKTAS